MRTLFLTMILFLGALPACGVKKTPTPLYAYPYRFEKDAPAPTVTPTATPGTFR